MLHNNINKSEEKQLTQTAHNLGEYTGDSSIIKRALEFITKQNLSTPENRECVIQYEDTTKPGVAMGIYFLSRADLLTPKNRELLVQAAIIVGSKIDEGLRVLDEAKLLSNGSYQYLTQENFEFLKQHAIHARGVALVLRDLIWFNLLTPENRQLLATEAASAINITEAFSRLLEAEEDSEVPLITQECYELLIQHVQYANVIARGIESLVYAQIYNPENQGLLIQHVADSAELGEGLNILSKENILTPENRELLIQFSAYAEKIATILQLLSKASLLTSENASKNRELLIQNVTDTSRLAKGLKALSEATLSAIEAKATRGFIIRLTNHADNIAKMLETLMEANLATQQNYELFIKHAAHAGDLALMLENLTKVGLGNQENYNTLIRYRDFSDEISSKIKSFKCKTQEDFNAIIEGINTRLTKEKIAFCMTDHVRLGAKSPAGVFFKSAIADPKNLSQEIFNFLPKPR